MQRSGATNHIVLKQRAENLSRLYPEYFNKVLLDAPCTALGTYFSTSEKYSWWSDKKLEKLSRLQYQLMVSAIKCLRVGGEMVYSTCSVAPEENELMIEKITRKYPVEVTQINPNIHKYFEPGWTSYNKSQISEDLAQSLRIWPQIHLIEGFFIVKLKKKAGINNDNEVTPVDTVQTKDANDSEIKEVLNQISISWGIEDEFWKRFRYILTKARLWMLSETINEVPTDNFVSGGLLLAEQRLNGWKLVNGSSQYLSKNVTKRRLKLSDDELTALFEGGKIKYRNLSEDYYVLDYEGVLIGSIYHERGEIRIRLPHLFTRFKI
jgi:16S rRNA (cytosine1407-C5)-methyltransferase